MAVVIETTIGDLTVDLFVDERPKACLNFLKLCRQKYYNFNLFHTIQHGFIAQTGDPTGVGDGGESIWGHLEGCTKRYFAAEILPKIRHSEPGLISMVSLGDNMIGSQFFFTLGSDLTSLDGIHCVIGQVSEGLDILRKLNETICDNSHRPYQDIRITHTVILEDPFENPKEFKEPSRSPSPSAKRLMNGRIGADEDIDDTAGKTEQEVHEMLQEREAKARATILEIVGDLPDADIAPPENVLFVCKLNPVTTDDDLEIIFSRFGPIKGCEVIRDRVTGDSLQYAFVEFDDRKSCENAYFKMDNVLIDDRRIHVDFSQSVAKVQWKGKGRGLIYKDGNKSNKLNFSDYKKQNDGKHQKDRRNISPAKETKRNRSRSPVARNQMNSRDRNQSNYDRERRRNGSRDRKRSVSPRNRKRSVSPKDRIRNLSPRSRKQSVSPRDRKRMESAERGRKSPARYERNRYDSRRDDRSYETNYRSHQRHRSRSKDIERNTSRTVKRSKSPQSRARQRSRSQSPRTRKHPNSPTSDKYSKKKSEIIIKKHKKLSKRHRKYSTSSSSSSSDEPKKHKTKQKKKKSSKKKSKKSKLKTKSSSSSSDTSD